MYEALSVAYLRAHEEFSVRLEPAVDHERLINRQAVSVAAGKRRQHTSAYVSKREHTLAYLINGQAVAVAAGKRRRKAQVVSPVVLTVVHVPTHIYSSMRTHIWQYADTCTAVCESTARKAAYTSC